MTMKKKALQREQTLTPVNEKKAEANAFYKEAIQLLNESGVPYLLGGGFAVKQYTGIMRDTKDLDIFCKAVDYPLILKFFSDKGFEVVHYDVRWLAKIFKGEHFIDIIFDSVNNVCTVDDTWFEHAQDGEYEGLPVKFVSAEELVWCKTYVQNRERFDGADVNHVILRYGKQLDWHRVLHRLDRHWHLLLSEIINFQFVYPYDYHELIPRWLFDELIKRAQMQYELPPPMQRVCRGPMIDNTQYSVDIKQWDYKSYTIITV
jgi:predicted nucleotidyltransferase